MHRLPSATAVTRFRLAAVLFIVSLLLIPAGLALLGYSLLVYHMDLLVGGAALFGLGILFLIMQWVVSARARCPLCLTPALAKKNCSKHRNARRFMGSYRLRVALAALFKGRFRCPYCGEKTAMEARQRRH